MKDHPITEIGFLMQLRDFIYGNGDRPPTLWGAEEMINARLDEIASSDPSPVELCMRSMIIALHREDSDTYWASLERFLVLHDEEFNKLPHDKQTEQTDHSI